MDAKTSPPDDTDRENATDRKQSDAQKTARRNKKTKKKNTALNTGIPIIRNAASAPGNTESSTLPIDSFKAPTTPTWGAATIRNAVSRDTSGSSFSANSPIFRYGVSSPIIRNVISSPMMEKRTLEEDVERCSILDAGFQDRFGDFNRHLTRDFNGPSESSRFILHGGGSSSTMIVDDSLLIVRERNTYSDLRGRGLSKVSSFGDSRSFRSQSVPRDSAGCNSDSPPIRKTSSTGGRLKTPYESRSSRGSRQSDCHSGSYEIGSKSGDDHEPWFQFAALKWADLVEGGSRVMGKMPTLPFSAGTVQRTASGSVSERELVSIITDDPRRGLRSHLWNFRLMFRFVVPDRMYRHILYTVLIVFALWFLLLTWENYLNHVYLDWKLGRLSPASFIWFLQKGFKEQVIGSVIERVSDAGERLYDFGQRIDDLAPDLDIDDFRRIVETLPSRARSVVPDFILEDVRSFHPDKLKVSTLVERSIAIPGTIIATMKQFLSYLLVHTFYTDFYLQNVIYRSEDGTYVASLVVRMFGVDSSLRQWYFSNIQRELSDFSAQFSLRQKEDSKQQQSTSYLDGFWSKRSSTSKYTKAVANLERIVSTEYDNAWKEFLAFSSVSHGLLLFSSIPNPLLLGSLHWLVGHLNHNLLEVMSVMGFKAELSVFLSGLLILLGYYLIHGVIYGSIKGVQNMQGRFERYKEFRKGVNFEGRVVLAGQLKFVSDLVTYLLETSTNVEYVSEDVKNELIGESTEDIIAGAEDKIIDATTAEIEASKCKRCINRCRHLGSRFKNKIRRSFLRCQRGLVRKCGRKCFRRFQAETERDPFYVTRREDIAVMAILHDKMCKLCEVFVQELLDWSYYSEVFGQELLSTFQGLAQVIRNLPIQQNNMSEGEEGRSAFLPTSHEFLEAVLSMLNAVKMIFFSDEIDREEDDNDDRIHSSESDVESEYEQAGEYEERYSACSECYGTARDSAVRDPEEGLRDVCNMSLINTGILNGDESVSGVVVGDGEVEPWNIGLRHRKGGPVNSIPNEGLPSQRRETGPEKPQKKQSKVSHLHPIIMVGPCAGARIVEDARPGCAEMFSFDQNSKSTSDDTASEKHAAGTMVKRPLQVDSTEPDPTATKPDATCLKKAILKNVEIGADGRAVRGKWWWEKVPWNHQENRPMTAKEWLGRYDNRMDKWLESLQFDAYEAEVIRREEVLYSRTGFLNPAAYSHTMNGFSFQWVEKNPPGANKIPINSNSKYTMGSKPSKASSTLSDSYLGGYLSSDSDEGKSSDDGESGVRSVNSNVVSKGSQGEIQIESKQYSLSGATNNPVPNYRPNTLQEVLEDERNRRQTGEPSDDNIALHLRDHVKDFEFDQRNQSGPSGLRSILPFRNVSPAEGYAAPWNMLIFANLMRFGYTRRRVGNIFYDWRKSAVEWEADGTFVHARTVLELYRARFGKPAILVSYSMGANFIHAFLSWLEKQNDLHLVAQQYPYAEKRIRRAYHSSSAHESCPTGRLREATPSGSNASISSHHNETSQKCSATHNENQYGQGHDVVGNLHSEQGHHDSGVGNEEGELCWQQVYKDLHIKHWIALGGPYGGCPEPLMNALMPTRASQMFLGQVIPWIHSMDLRNVLCSWPGIHTLIAQSGVMPAKSNCVIRMPYGVEGNQTIRQTIRLTGVISLSRCDQPRHRTPSRSKDIGNGGCTNVDISSDFIGESDCGIGADFHSGGDDNNHDDDPEQSDSDEESDVEEIRDFYSVKDVDLMFLQSAYGWRKIRRNFIRQAIAKAVSRTNNINKKTKVVSGSNISSLPPSSGGNTSPSGSVNSMKYSALDKIRLSTSDNGSINSNGTFTAKLTVTDKAVSPVNPLSASDCLLAGIDSFDLKLDTRSGQLVLGKKCIITLTDQILKMGKFEIGEAVIPEKTVAGNSKTSVLDLLWSKPSSGSIAPAAPISIASGAANSVASAASQVVAPPTTILDLFLQNLNEQLQVYVVRNHEYCEALDCETKSEQAYFLHRRTRLTSNFAVLGAPHVSITAVNGSRVPTTYQYRYDQGFTNFPTRVSLHHGDGTVIKESLQMPMYWTNHPSYNYKHRYSFENGMLPEDDVMGQAIAMHADQHKTESHESPNHRSPRRLKTKLRFSIPNDGFTTKRVPGRDACREFIRQNLGQTGLFDRRGAAGSPGKRTGPAGAGDQSEPNDGISTENLDKLIDRHLKMNKKVEIIDMDGGIHTDIFYSKMRADCVARVVAIQNMT